MPLSGTSPNISHMKSSFASSRSMVCSDALPDALFPAMNSLQNCRSVTLSASTLRPSSSSRLIRSRTFLASALVPRTVRDFLRYLPVMGSLPSDTCTSQTPRAFSMMLPSPFAISIHLLSLLCARIYPKRPSRRVWLYFMSLSLLRLFRCPCLS